MSAVITHNCAHSTICRLPAGKVVANNSGTDFHFNFTSWHDAEFHQEVLSLRRMIDSAKRLDPILVKKVLQEALELL